MNSGTVVLERTPDSLSAKSILAVVVLYKLSAAESSSFSGLHALLNASPEADQAIELMVCDNSPSLQPRRASFSGVYLADPSNPGLARCYNQALQRALERGIPWLLLLDQDTTVTAEYVREVVLRARELQQDTSIVALVPKLLQNGVVQSPHAPPTYKHPKFDRKIVGRRTSRTYAFNSASVIRVSALAAIGGFPEEFWLDFLDHATFHLLQRNGGHTFVLHSCLAHELSANSMEKRDAAGRKRYGNILDAEFNFYRRYGSPMDRFFMRIRLLRGCLGQLIKRRNPGEALQMFRAAVRF